MVFQHWDNAVLTLLKRRVKVADFLMTNCRISLTITKEVTNRYVVECILQNNFLREGFLLPTFYKCGRLVTGTFTDQRSVSILISATDE